MKHKRKLTKFISHLRHESALDNPASSSPTARPVLKTPTQASVATHTFGLVALLIATTTLFLNFYVRNCCWGVLEWVDVLLSSFSCCRAICAFLFCVLPKLVSNYYSQ